MPRVYEVKKARASKRTRTCRTCGHVIQPGESYRYFEPRYGPAVMYCADHYPKRGDMTSSKLGPLYDAQDDFAPEGTLEEVQSALQDIANIAEEIAGEYEESISNMPEGLQEGPTAEEMREKIDALQSYAQDLESFDPDMEEFDEDHAREECEAEVASEMIEEMDLDEVREQIDSDVVADPDDDVEHPDPLEGMEEKDIITQYGDESDFTSRVDARVQERREAFDEEHGEEMDNVYSEASELVAQFDY